MCDEQEWFSAKTLTNKQTNKQTKEKTTSLSKLPPKQANKKSNLCAYLFRIFIFSLKLGGGILDFRHVLNSADLDECNWSPVKKGQQTRFDI